MTANGTTEKVLTPIVDKVDAAPVVSRLVWSTHNYTLDIRSKPAREHLRVSLVTRGVNSSNQT